MPAQKIYSRCLSWTFHLYQITPILIIFCAFQWFIFNCFRYGLPWDEAEHAHIAWLISVKGLQAGRDFYQHHTPVFWSVLGLVYKLGIHNPEILFVSRFISSFAILFAWLLSAYICFKREPAKFPISAISSLCLIIYTTCSLDGMLVGRPDVIGIMFCILSAELLFLSKPKIVLSAIMFALALAFSPRFLPLVPGFFLLISKKEFNFAVIKSCMYFLAVIFLSLILYGAFSGYSFEYFAFILKFNAIAQRVGPGNSDLLFQILLWNCVIALSMLFSFFVIDKKARLEWSLLACWWLIVAVLSFVSSYKYFYSQGFVSTLAWSLVMYIRLRDLFESKRLSKPIAIILMSFLFLLSARLGIYLYRDYQEGWGIDKSIACRQRMLSFLHQDDKVLLTSGGHPIMISDSSFYVIPLGENNPDYRNRLCTTIQILEDSSLPKCNYVTDIKNNNPVIIEKWIVGMLSSEQIRDLMPYLETHYTSLPKYYVRNDRAISEAAVKKWC